jgi:hypothetical protein
MFRSILVLSATILLNGCAYQAAVDIAPAYNVYSSYDDKIPGSWALYIDSSAFENQDFRFDGFNCAAHTFPLDISSTFTQSALRTLDNIVENIQLVDRPLTTDQLESDGLSGIVIIDTEEIDVSLRVNPGFWSSNVDAEVELVASIAVDGRTGRLLGTTVSEDGDFEGPLGGFCGGGGPALGEAASNAIEALLERVAERLTNAPRVREYSI